MATKLPQSLFDTYQEYKAEEEELIEWIKKTAVQCGHQFGAKAASGKSSLSKSRGARHSTVKTSNTSRTQRSLPQITLFDIKAPLQTIVASGKIMPLPTDIARIFRSVLRKRVKCVEWFKRNISPDDVNGQRLNHSHQYPLQVLREAADTVAPLLRLQKLPDTSAYPEKDEDKTDVKFDTNHFSLLELEDPDLSGKLEQLEVRAPPSSTSGRSDSSPDDLKAHEWNDLQATLSFARYCLLQELDAIEAVLLQEWFNVLLNGQTSIGAVVITNHAIDLIQKREVAVGMIVINNNHRIIFPENFFVCLSRTPAGNAIESTLRMHEIVFKVLTQPGKKTRRLARDARSVLERMDYFSACVDEQAEFELRALCLWLTASRAEVGQYVKTGYINGSEVSRLLRHLYDNISSLTGPADVPTTVAFAARIEILISHVLRTHESNIKQELLNTVDSLQLTLQHQIARMSTDNGFLDTYGYPEHDILAEKVAGILQSTFDKQEVLRELRNPVCATGLLDFGMGGFRDYCAGPVLMVDTLVYSGFLVSLAHIYNVCCEEGVLSIAWPDLDFILKHVGDEPIFRGDRPTKLRPDYYFDRLSHMDGFSSRSIKKWLKSPDKGKPMADTPSADALAMLVQTSALPLCTAVLARSFDSSRFNDQWAWQVELILRATRVQDMLGKRPVSVTMISEAKLVNQQQLTSFYNKGPHMEAIHVLALSRQRVLQELSFMAFDFDKFFDSCLALVACLVQCWTTNRYQSSPSPITVQKDGPAGLSLFRIAVDLTYELKKVEHGAHERRARSREQLVNVGQILAEFIAKKGTIGIDAISKQSPKHISTLTPSFQEKLRSIATQFGLLEGMFTAEQKEDLEEAFKKTVKIEDVIKELYSGKRTGHRDVAKRAQEQMRKYLEAKEGVLA